jgi:hypothetical protein
MKHHEAVSNKFHRTIALVAVVVVLGDDLLIEQNQEDIILF